MKWLVGFYFLGWLLLLYPVTTWLVNDISAGHPETSDWVLGTLFASVFSLIWPVVLAGGAMFVASRGLWLLIAGRDEERVKV